MADHRAATLNDHGAADGMPVSTTPMPTTTTTTTAATPIVWPHATAIPLAMALPSLPRPEELTHQAFVRKRKAEMNRVSKKRVAAKKAAEALAMLPAAAKAANTAAATAIAAAATAAMTVVAARAPSPLPAAAVQLALQRAAERKVEHEARKEARKAEQEARKAEQEREEQERAARAVREEQERALALSILSPVMDPAMLRSMRGPAKSTRLGAGSRQITIQDAWRVLGVPVNASSSDCLRAYKKRIVRVHPDKCLTRIGQFAARTLGEAKQILCSSQQVFEQ